MKSLFKVTPILLLASMLASCASTDSYRGEVSNAPIPADRDKNREIALSAALSPTFGLLSPLVARGINRTVCPKDPATAPFASTTGKTKYLEPVASASSATPATSPSKVAPDQNGTTYLAQ